MKRPLKNFFFLVVGDAGSRLLGFFITVYLARVLEPAAFGVINIALSVLGYLILLASPGVQAVETRNVAAFAGTNESRVNSVVSLRLFLSLALLIVTTMITVFIIRSRETRESVLLFSLSLVPLSLFLDWFFYGKERFGAITGAKLLNSLVYGGAVLALVYSADDTRWVAVAFALGNSAATVFLFTHYRRKFGTLKVAWQPAAWQPAEWKSILASNVPVGFAMCLAQSATNLPPIILGWLVSNVDAGMFSAAMKITFLLLMLDRILNALFLPVVTRYLASHKDETGFLITTVVKFVLIVVLPTTVCGVAFAPIAVPLIFGSSYAEAIPLLQILMGYFLLTLVNSLFVCILFAAGRELAYTAAITIGSVVFVAAIVTGALLMGTEGAAVGVVIGELITVVMMARQARKTVDVFLWNAARGPIVAGVLMVGVVVLLQEQSVVIRSCAALAAFVAALFALKSVHANEIRFLRERFV